MAVILGCAIESSMNHGSMLKEYDTDCEVFRQQFRNFQYQHAAGPREAFSKLWELCYKWLKPNMCSKEEILEQVVLDQFLNILPPEIETWVRLYHPEDRERLLTVVGELHRELQIPGQQVNRQEMCLEELSPEETADIPPDYQLLSPELHVLEPFQEATVADAWIQETWIPEACIPEVSIPEASIPEAWIPEASIPEAWIPEVSVPEAWIPEASIPEAWIPEPEPEYPEDDDIMACQSFYEPGFDADSENEEYVSQQKNLEDMYQYFFTFEDSALHAQALQENYEYLENRWENLPHFSKFVHDQDYSLEETPESFDLEEFLTSTPTKKESPQEQHPHC